MRTAALAAVLTAGALTPATSAAAPPPTTSTPTTISEGDNLTAEPTGSTGLEGAALASRQGEVDDGTRPSAVSLRGGNVATVGAPYQLTVDDSTDAVTSWAITWGDGTVSTGDGPPGVVTHTYGVAGVSDVTVQVTNDDGTWLDAEIVVPHYDTTGTISRYDAATGTSIDGLASASSIGHAWGSTIGPDGALYVSGTNPATIERYDLSTGDHLNTVVEAGDHLEGPRDLDFGPDGLLYVADGPAGRISRYTPAGEFIDHLQGPAPGSKPRGLLFAPNDTLLVADAGNDTIEAFDITTGQWAKTHTQLPAGAEPSALTWAPGGNIYVSLTGRGTVVEVDAQTGDHVVDLVANDLSAPTDIRIGPDGALWVADYWTDQIKRFATTDGSSLGPAITAASPGGIRTFTIVSNHRVRVSHGLVVNTTTDTADPNPGDGLCDTGAGAIAGQPECSLRAAIAEANAAGSPTSIAFNIATADPGYSANPTKWTIEVAGPLPAVTKTVTIDASSQPGYKGFPLVVLDASGVAAGNVLTVEADGTIIRGLSFQHHPDTAIAVDGGAGTVIEGSHFGVDVDGLTAAGGGAGVSVSANETRIGGRFERQRNIFGGLQADAISILGSSARTVIEGNMVGVDASGQVALPNAGMGIFIADGTASTLIGGTQPGAGNTVAYHSSHGVRLGAEGAESTVIANRIHSNGGSGIDAPGINGTAVPTINSATATDAAMSVQVTLDAAAAGAYRVELFTNPTSDGPATDAEGEHFVAARTVLHTGEGPETFTLAVPGSAGDTLSSTATEVQGPGSFGATSAFSSSVAVVAASGTPTANAGGPYLIGEGDSLALHAGLSADPGGGGLVYEWDLDGDGRFDDATGVTAELGWDRLVALGFGDHGSYPIGLRVRDSSGDSDSAAGSVLVTNAEPRISVSGPANAEVGTAYKITVDASDPGDDTVAGWSVSWGDGTVDSFVGVPGSADHTYTDTGSRNVAVSVTDEDGTWSSSDLVVPSFDAGAHVGRYGIFTGTYEANLVAGADVNSVGAVALGPDGLVYASSYLTSSVVRLDPTTNTYIDTFVDEGTGGLLGPMGLAFTPGGNLLVADGDSDVVLEYDGATGAFLGTFVEFRSGDLRSPSGLRFGPDGNLYVSSFESDDVKRYRRETGAFLDTFVESKRSGGLDMPEDLAWAPSGDLLVASAGTDEVKRYDGETGDYLGNLIPAGSGGLDYPSGLAVGADGHLLVASRLSDEVKRYDGNTGAYLDDAIAAGEGGLDGPHYFALVGGQQVTVQQAAPELLTGDEWLDRLPRANPRAGLTFEANGGRATEELDFMARARNYRAALSDGDALLIAGSTDVADAVRMNLVGSTRGRSGSVLRGSSAGTEAIEYEAIYPGINIEYSANGDQLEYSFVIAAGADPDQIALDFDGATGVSIDADGSLLINTGTGTNYRSTAPITYQEIWGDRVLVESRYRIAEDGTVGFELGDYNAALPLIIDPTFVAVATGGGFIPDGGTLNLPVPGGVSAGEVLIAQVNYNANAGSTITPAAGWTTIDVEENPSHGVIQALYWRVATAAEPAQYGFTLTSGKTDSASGAIAAYSGVDTTNPIDAFAGQSNGTSTSLVAPSITTTVPDTTLIAFYSVRGQTPINPPAGMTERWDIGSLSGVGAIGEAQSEAADETLGAAGSTGTRTATTAASDGSIGHLVALKPDATATYLDQFNNVAYDGSDGTLDWAPNPWLETGEADGAAGGHLSIVSNAYCSTGRCLQIRSDAASVDRLTRTADLSGAMKAELTFNYRRRLLSGAGGATITLEASDDGGLSFNPLASYVVSASDPGVSQEALDLTPFIAADTQIRFSTDGSNLETALYVDDFQIEFEAACTDSDGDGLCDVQEDANTDLDGDPATNPGPDTDGDTFPNYLDADDDGDAITTAAEAADPNGDGDPRDALDSDRDGQPDYLDDPTGASDGTVDTEQKISDLTGGLTATLDNDDYFGTGVAAIGDLDGDGIDDIVEATQYDDDGGTNRGAVHILFLNANGTVKAEQKISDTIGGLTTTLDDSDLFGVSAAGIGDVDGDGINDIAVGALNDDDGGNNRGAVYILFLNANGTVKAEQKISDTAGGLTGTLNDNDGFGIEVAGIGDLDGDGINDIAAGAYLDDDGGTDRGAAYVLFLNANGTVKAEQKISDTTGGLTAALTNTDLFGVAIAGIGDLDGDGINDIAAAAYLDDDGGNNRGAVYILFLNANGTVKAEQKISDTTGGLTATLDDSDFFGNALTGIGDLDDDGVKDIAVAAMFDDDGGADPGAVHILFLNANGTVKAEQKISDTAGGLTATLDDTDRFGISVAGIGDLDGDGLIDIAVGAHLDDDGGSNRGAVYILHLAPAAAESVVFDNVQNGTATLANGSPSVAAAIAAVDPAKSFLTFSVRGNNGSPDNLWINGELTNATTVTFSRPGTTGNVTIEWSVVEFSSGVTVQRGSTGLTGTTTDVAISSVDLTKSFPTISSTATGSVFSNNDFVSAELTSATNLRLSISSLGTNVVKWQVVTYNDASVQSGNVAFASGDASKTATITSVDTSKAWLLYSLDTTTGTQSNIGQKLVRGQVSNDTTLTFDRSNTGQTMNLTYYLVEFTDTTEVQHATVPFLTADTTKNVTITAVDPTRAIGLGGYLQYGGRSSYATTDNPGVGWFTTKLTSATNLEVRRDAALATADLGWTVVHWPGVVTPLVVNSTGDASDTTPGDGVCDTGANNSQGNPECTLRAAIEEANALSNHNDIHFAIPQTETGYAASPEAFTITPGSVYDDITHPVSIDGATQAEYGPNPVIQLDGKDATGATAGLVLETDDSLINGLIVHSFDDEGVEIDASTGGGQRNTLSNNWVGIDASEVAKANLDVGVLLTVGAGDNVVTGNVISGNATSGLVIRNPGSDSNIIQGNTIGLAPDGVTPRPNGSHGVEIYDAAASNLIGGTGLGEGNTIFSNIADGVALTATAGSGNSIIGNSIRGNTGLGIDLSNDGVTANSNIDAWLDYPYIVAATEAAGSVTVDFDLEVPAGTYRIEAFTNPAGPDDTGYGEGELYQSAQAIVHSGSGSESFQLTYSGSVDDIVTLTATEDLGGGSYGSTSEFSSAATVGAARVNSTGDTPDAVPGDHTCDTGGVNSEGDPECTLRAALEEANASNLVDAVAFHIPTTESGHGAAPLRYTIRLASALPVITEAVTIDGTTQPDYPGTPVIDLWGIDVLTDSGIEIAAGSSTVRGVVIRSFDAHGIVLATGNNNVIESSYIGTDVTGAADFGNGGDGISIQLGSSDNTIGGTGTGNVIAFNNTFGVDVEAGDRNAIFDNSVFANGDLGINLAGGTEDGFGVTANDAGDGDTGPNDLLNHPVTTSAAPTGIIAVLSGTFDVPAGNYRFDFYKNPSGLDASGYGEGEQWVATSTLAHSGAGPQGWGAAFVGAVGDVITVTVTEDLGAGNFGPTSEFSQAAIVKNPIVVNSTRDAADSTPGDFVCDTGTTNTAGDPECTLRAAIEEANALAGDDAISFAMPATESGHSGGVWTLAPATALPALTQTVKIDGSTQPGHIANTAVAPAGLNGTPVVEIDGGDMASDGIVVSADDVELRGLIVHSFANDTIQFDAKRGSIVGSYLGTDATGTNPLGGFGGIRLGTSTATDTAIGGTVPADRNLISGFSYAIIGGAGRTFAAQGNLIGTDAAGTSAVPNTTYAFSVTGNQAGSQIGGTTAGAGNVISGNSIGIGLVGGGSNMVVQGNYIGVDATGLAPLPNSLGLWLSSGATDNQIGGSTAAAANVIAGNTSRGIRLADASTANTITGNYIGTDAGETVAIPNLVGIYIEETAFDNQIGGTTDAEKNVIAHNTGDGIGFKADAGSGNTIVRNKIHSNGGLGIDIDNDGVTANDADDVDGGPNDRLNFPVIASATETGGIVTVTGTFDVPAGDYRFDFYENPSGADPSGYGEGELWVGTSVLSHAGGGDQGFGAAFLGTVGDVITATVTEQSTGPVFGSTSEFSAAATVTPPNDPPVADAGGPYSIGEGDPLTLDGSGSSDPNPDTLTYAWDLDNDTFYDDATTVGPTVPWATLAGLGLNDDGGPFTIGLEVDDSNGGTDTDTTTLTITNTAPTLTTTGSVTTEQGSLYTLNLAASDPGADTITSWTINWGDGTIETIAGNPSSTTHTYSQRGDTAEITASATDEDGTWWNAQLIVPGMSTVDQLLLYEPVSGAFVDNLMDTLGFGKAAGAAWGPDGDLYVSVWQAPGRGIHRFDGTTFAHLSQFVADGAGGLGDPWGLTFGPNGHLYVTSNSPDGVYRYNGATGAFIDLFASPAGNTLAGPGGIAFGPDNNLYVSSFSSDEVLQFDGDTGAYLDDFVSVGDGGLDAPEGLLFRDDGYLYVASKLDNSVKRYSVFDGSHFDDFVAPGSGTLSQPSGITFGPDGDLYVSSRNTDRVKRYDGTSGAYVGNFVTVGSGGLVDPYYLAFVPDEQVTVLPPANVVEVNSTGDAGDAIPGDDVCDTGGTNADGRTECTLRAAIEEANASATINTIEFAIPVTDPGHTPGPPTHWTIQPLLALPAITQTVTIDASTQPFSSPTTAAFPAAIDAALAIELDGVTGAGNGLEISAGSAEIRGLAINRFHTGIAVLGGASSKIQGNFIGADVTGAVGAVGNTATGVRIYGAANTMIGGGAAADRNLISGNRQRGVFIDDYSDGAPAISDGTTVVGNFIGTNAAGTAVLPYDGGGAAQQMGIALWDGPDNAFGGAAAGEGNLLSGNSWYGIYIWGPNSSGNTIEGNIVGLDASASFAVGNGSSDPASRSGLYLSNAPGNGIGGVNPGEANTVAGNDAKGIIVYGASALSNNVLGNEIYNNAGLGLDLGIDDVTPNDTDDLDGGPNDHLNFPEISTVQRIAGDLELDISLDVAAGDYRIEIFSNTAADPSGHGEGETLLGAQTITHTGSGTETFTLAVTSAATILTLTATEDLGAGTYGATSEFSAAVPSPDLVIVNSTGDTSDNTTGDGQCDTGGTNADGDPECTLHAAIAEANDPATPVDTIWFGIPATDTGHSGGVWTISGAALPTVTAETTIDATTQTGWAANTSSPLDALDGTMTVVLDGAAAGAANGLNLSGDDIAVKGLVIGGFNGVGVMLSGARAVLQGSYIGTDTAGTAANANTGDGISINGPDAVIGSPNPADRVLVAGNGSQGINVNATNAAILGSIIGLDATAATPLPNGANGVRLSGITNATVGAPGAGNLVSGNNMAPATADGIYISGGDSHTIQANLIGTNASGDALGNYNAGVAVSGASDVLIGGTAVGEGNTVAHNGADGVQVTGGSTDVSVLGNTLVDNTGLGIDIANDGVSANDPGDGDAGPNDLLNKPVLSGATASAGSVNVDFTLDVPAGTYRIEFFSNPAGADPSGYGEGEALAGFASVTHDGSGAKAFSHSVAGGAGSILTATATETVLGNPGPTSEFSNAVTAIAAADTTISDSSVRRSHLAALGGVDPSSPAVGLAGDAVDFGGGSDRLVGPGLDITDGALSVSAWVNLDTTGSQPRLLSKRSGAGTVLYELAYDDATGEAYATLRIGGAPVNVRGGSVATGAWHHVAASWDGAEVILYVDGAEVDRTPAVGTLTTDATTPIAVGNTATGTQPLDGRLDHVSVSHASTSAASLAAHHANVSDPASFVSVGAQQSTTPGAWTVTGGQARSGGFALTAPETTGPDAAAWAVATGIDEPGAVFESWWWMSTDSGVDLSSGTRAGAAPTDQYESALTSSSGWELRRRSGPTESTDASAAGSPSTGTWVKVELWTDQVGDSRLFIDGTEVTGWTSQGSDLLSGSLGLRTGLLPTGETWYIDDARARKLITTEPTTTLGPLDRN